MCDLLTDNVVETIRRNRTNTEPHLASIEEIARFRAVRMAADGLRVGKAVQANYQLPIDSLVDEYSQAYTDTH